MAELSRRPFMVIGAPVHERAWVLPDWLAHLASQDLPWDRVTLLFNYGRSSDGTLEIIRDAQDMLPWDVRVLIDDGDDHVARRAWSLQRYGVMTRLRNELLHWVRKWEPEYYLSLDTDILLPDGAIQGLLEDMATGKFDAVAPKLYMTPRGTHYPNCMRLDSGTRPKLDHDFTMLVDVVFAAVLMSPDLYRAVDYAPHSRGEDIGWGVNARRAGMRMGINPTIACKHVMAPEMLDAVDPRLGW